MAEHGVVELLPEVIRSTALPGSPLAALGAAADDMHRPVVDVLDHLDDVVDPFRAPARFVRYLAGWVDLGWVGTAEGEAGARAAAGMTVTRLRDVIAASADLAARRGTPGGLARFLHLATGVDGFRIEAVPGEFHVRVVVPTPASDQADLVRHLVQALRPAHVTSEVVLGGEVLPAVPAGVAGGATPVEAAVPVDATALAGDEPSPPVTVAPPLPLAPAPGTLPPSFPPDPAQRRARSARRDGPPPPPSPPGG